MWVLVCLAHPWIHFCFAFPLKARRVPQRQNCSRKNSAQCDTAQIPTPRSIRHCAESDLAQYHTARSRTWRSITLRGVGLCAVLAFFGLPKYFRNIITYILRVMAVEVFENLKKLFDSAQYHTEQSPT